MGAAILRDDLRQADVDAFELALLDQRRLNLMAAASNRSAMLRASIEAKWWVSPETSVRTVIENGAERKEWLFNGLEVGAMEVRDVWHLGAMVVDMHTALTAFDPNWSWG